MPESTQATALTAPQIEQTQATASKPNPQDDELALLRAKIKQLEQQLAGKSQPPGASSPAALVTPQHRLRAKVQPSPVPSPASTSAKQAPVADTAVDDEDEEQDVEDEGKGKVMVTSPDGTIATCIDNRSLCGP